MRVWRPASEIWVMPMDGHHEGAATDAVEIPAPRHRDSLRATFEETIRQHPAAGDVAAAVAILGPHATVAVTAAVLRCSEATLRTAAMPLQLGGILASATPFRFAHTDLRAIALAASSELRMTELRLSAAEVLATQVDDLEVVVAHVMSVGPTGRPEHLIWLREAAASAMNRGASSAAVAYLRRALLEGMPPATRAAVVRDLAYAEAAAWQPQASIRMRTLLADTTEPRDRALISQRLGLSQMYEGRMSEALHTLDMGAAEIPHNDPLAREMRADALAISLMYVSQATDVASREQVVAQDAGHDDRAGVRTRAVLAYASVRRSEAADVDTLIAAMNEPTIGAAALSVSPALIMGNTAALFGGRPSEARALAKRVMAWGAEHGYHGLFMTGGFRQAEVDCWEGRVDDVITFARDIAAEAEARDQARRMLWVVVLPWIRALIAQGSVAVAESVLARSGLLRVPVEDQAWPAPLLARGLYREAAGQHALALEDVLACGRLLEAKGHSRSMIVSWRSAAVRIYAALGRTADAVAMAEEELALATSLGEPRMMGRALRGLALVGTPDVDLLTASVDVLSGTTASLQHARSRIELGRALLRAGRRRDARTHLRIGHDLALSCHVPGLVEVAAQELRASGAHRIERPVSGPAALTSTELRVAELAARGQTNQEIARALTVSLKTVEMHLGHAYRKLGILRRTDLADALAEEP